MSWTWIVVLLVSSPVWVLMSLIVLAGLACLLAAMADIAMWYLRGRRT